MSEWHYETNYPLHCAMITLAHNLAVAAGLCRAFALGEYFERDTAVGGWRLGLRWVPGCGRKAP